MKEFSYTAYDYSGKKIEGIYRGKDKAELELKLKENSQLLLKANELKLEKTKRIKSKEIQMLMRNLGKLIKTGLTIKKSLQFQRESIENKTLIRKLQKIEDDIQMGEELYESFEKQNILKPTYINLLRVGEVSGNLGESFFKVFELMKLQEYYKIKIRNIMIYPIVVIGTSLVIINFMVFFILPNFLEMFTQNNQELPIITSIIIFGLELLKENYFSILVALFFIVIFLKKFSNNNNIYLKIPIFRKIYRDKIAMEFCRTLFLLLEAGIHFSMAFDIATEDLETYKLKIDFSKIRISVKEGTVPSLIFKEINLLSRENLGLIKLGEESGEIGKMLEEVSKNIEFKINERIELFLQLLEPILILVIGISLGIVVIALYLPIFNIIDNFDI
ncbi:type II secretion system F family protein [Cetobacterium sp. 2A]|uniref:type II secretion system F family protein n=1 Tax=Cetobacterium sp. 2A TaxID=2754723 RepID=UPI00163BEEAE|nr:type II secretion system F family protein [Cetobacterium sp. 2A]MBC2856312.1 type II secretion system F family protein [Cetobacterium sp. 2A]